MFLDLIYLKDVVLMISICFFPADFSLHTQHSDDDYSRHEGKDRATEGGS